MLLTPHRDTGLETFSVSKAPEGSQFLGWAQILEETMGRKLAEEMDFGRLSK